MRKGVDSWRKLWYNRVRKGGLQMITTKGICAIRFMMDLAEHTQEKLIPLDDTADRQALSKKYLEIVVKDLVRGKLVKGVSGKGGGYCLTRAPEEYTVAEILELTEGTLAPVACLAEDAEPCCNSEKCEAMMPMWRGLNTMIHDYFAGITIADLVGGNVGVVCAAADKDC